MFGVVEILEQQFTRIDGGYLVYPSPRRGGKFVTDEEHDRLVRNWSRVAGWRGILIAVAAAFAIVAAWFLGGRRFGS